MQPPKPQQLTAKQELFAQLVAKGSKQVDAYRQAYDTSPDASRDTAIEDASHLAASPKIAPRIEELKAAYQQAAMAELAWDQAQLVRQADRHRELALTGGWRGVSAANGALEIIGRATGLLNRQVEVNISGQLDVRHSLASWSLEELDALIAAKDQLLASGWTPPELGQVVEGAGKVIKEEEQDDGLSAGVD